MASTLRLDSIVWSCCKLLYPSQQPSICQDHIVTDFLNRYLFSDIAVSTSDLAQEGSDEEIELQTFLDMVSRSYPLRKMVCVESFIWPNRTLGYYNTSVYGCASPNALRSEFVGLLNPKLREMLHQRVWLSGDTFEILGMRIGIRQNSKSVIGVDKTASGSVVATTYVSTNFSCFGPLYSIMLAMDIVVLFMYARAGYESTKWLLGPRYKNFVMKQANTGRLLSWIFVLPNIVLWNWGLVESTKVRAAIASFRAVVLVMTLLDFCWAGVARLNEELAYFVSSRTFVSPLEIIAVSAGVARWKLSDIMLILDKKWRGENQRSPLFEAVGFSLLLAMIYAGLKGLAIYAYLYRQTQARTYDARGNGLHGQEYGEYRRLADELLLDFPIRARCLMRNNFSMEILVDNQRLGTGLSDEVLKQFYEQLKEKA
ncbi:hypothetical protein PybrP1_002345, partial [[Pythium] brassicae (nom. inval.)]